MISKIILHNFKCFNHREVELKPLTFLSGVNGMGKSTIIQSLLLLRQSMQKSNFELNGDLFKFGYVEDIYSETSEDDLFSIELKSQEGSNHRWASIVNREKSGELKLKTIDWPNNTSFDNTLFGGMFQFLSAERWGPRVSLPLNQDNSDRYYLGKHGEFLVSVIDNLEKTKLLNEDFPNHPDVKSRDTIAQLNAWMNEISPASTFDVKEIREADSGVYTFSYRSHLGKTKNFRPTNVGFGLSYTLPILTALLTARKGSLTLIENPEAHLHPKAQLILGKLIAMCANAGAQLIVESHSDHVLNGMRIAVKERLVRNEDIALHFVTRSDSNDLSSTYIESPIISPEGKLSSWPRGFFDEWDNALDKLL